MAFRTIYMLECYDDNSVCVIRRFYRNKRAAARACRQFDSYMCYVTLVPKRYYICFPEDVYS